jgi:hypothetical protein
VAIRRGEQQVILVASWNIHLVWCGRIGQRGGGAVRLNSY